MRIVFFVCCLLFANTLFAQSFNTGDKVDMYSTDGNYYAATVIEVSGDKCKIHFDAYDATKDTWVQAASLVRGGRQGEKLVVVSDKGTFFGTIIEVQNTIYKVKYDGYPDTYTLKRSQFSFAGKPTNPAAIQAEPTQTTRAQNNMILNTGGFTVGAKVQALQGTTWYAATIKEIKNDKYLVKYDNYNEEELLPKEKLRFKPSLPADKLSLTTGKIYIRSIRWIATGYTELNWYFLGDNGIIIVDPMYGLNPVNFALEQADNFKNIGYYSIANNQLNVSWLNGKKTTLGLTYKNGEIIEMDAGGIMVRQKGLGDNYKVSGTYTGSLSYGNVASAGTYTFSKDGRFTKNQTGTVNTAVGNGRANNSKTGTYSIKGNTLFVSYDDGTKETANIGLFDGMPGKMVFNGSWMTAQ